MSEQAENGIPAGLSKVYLGLLKKGPTWTPETTPEVEANQREHLKLLSKLGAAGDLLLAGPTPDDSDLRGIVLCQAESLEQAEALFGDDPHIGSQRLILEMHPLFVQKELLEQPLLRN